ncbi:Eukaryotic translation initiation factor 3 subunit A [Fasciola hepatica]|uniref:Eukaryotic translation initiation factor 3 subunit A n=1 Tax=Fasciola hepatica TaxID=6192 RepID=A0A4E0R3X4_FASHE|nr:Eukaryotic translation initiation factor 3 subunit A [Fasciola hepatica]
MRLRRAKQWQKVLEDLMMLFVDLCVELRKNVHFRKAIYQYKNISVMENTASLEAVIRYYLNSIKARTEEAQKESKSVLMDVEDLDILETPESLMLNAVSFEGSQDRSARTILMPWLKFLWDSYRLILDLLRSNAKLEHLYHEIANDAYEFCIKYGRRAEFRKLSELLRLHTQKVQNQLQPNAPNAINLNNPETQVLHFQTRLRQLDCAMELEMYNEAYKTVEDIWAFNMNLKKVTSAVLLTNYYSKSAELFLRCGCYLYHAAALQKLMFLYRDHKKNVTREELSSIGSRVLCATLAIPLPNAKVNSDKFLLSGEYTQAKQKTLSGLLNLFQVPTRQSLIHDLVRQKVTSLVPQELADLYTVLEADFQPMTLWERSQPALHTMDATPELSVYKSQLHEVLVSKVVLQLSQVYQTFHLNELVKLCPFMDPISLERIVIELIHNLELPIRINHRLQALVFDEFTDLGISQCDYGGQLVSQSTHVNAPDRLSRQLTMFAQVMQQITEMLDDSQQLPDYRKTLVSEYQTCHHEFHKELLNRRTYIEARKEQVELIQEERDQILMEEEARRQAELERRMQSEEMNLQKETEERERRKAEDEQARIRRRIALGNYNLLMESKIGVKLDSKDLTEEQLDQFDADKILEKKALEVNKKRKELAEKAKAMAKKLDYYTRACRLEELPLLQAAVEPEAEKAREEYERSIREIEEHSKAEHERQLAEKNRLIRMKTDVQLITAQLKDSRDKRYKARLAEWEELCDKTRCQRLADLKAEREAEAAAEAERKAREEEAAKREAELAAETERVKQALKAKEAEERTVAREEEERVRSANRKDEPPRSQALEDTDHWVRTGPTKGPSFEAPFKRPPAEPAARVDHPLPGFGRGARKTVPSEFERILHEDDPADGWTHVGHKDADRPHARPYVPPSLARGARHSAMTSSLRTGPPRREERRTNFGYSTESNDWSRGNPVGTNRGGSATGGGSDWRPPPKG